MLATSSKFVIGLGVLEIWLALLRGMSLLNPYSEYMLHAESFCISSVHLPTPSSDDGAVAGRNHRVARTVSLPGWCQA